MHERRLIVNKRVGMVVGISALMAAGAASAQGMLLDAAADKVIAKYQAATCDELKAQKKQPATDKEKEAVEFLRNDAKARTSFIDKTAAPVLNKMFDCGILQ